MLNYINFRNAYYLNDNVKWLLIFYGVRKKERKKGMLLPLGLVNKKKHFDLLFLDYNFVINLMD